MKKLMSKTNFSLLIITLCAMLFCGLFAISNLTPKKPTTANAYEVGSSATLQGRDGPTSMANENLWSNLLDYQITNLTITNSLEPTNYIGTPVDVSKEKDGRLKAYKIDNGDNTYDCIIYGNVETIYAPVNSDNLFGGQTISNNLTTLKSVDFQNFDTSNATSMGGMFNYCNFLTDINWSDNFNTSNVENMTCMFGECYNLQSIDVSKFDTSSVKYFNGMFSGCLSLNTLNLSNFNTGNAISMSDMFLGCGIKSLNLSSFDTSKVTDFDMMFFAMTWQTVADLYQLDLNSPTFYTDLYLILFEIEFDGTQEQAKQAIQEAMGGYILDESPLNYLDISSFTISADASLMDMFAGQTSLKTLVAPNACNADITLPFAMIEQGTSFEYLSLTSSSNGKTLVSPTTPTTGFIDEQLIPMLTIGLVSIVLVAVMFFKNKKKA